MQQIATAVDDKLCMYLCEYVVIEKELKYDRVI